MVACSDTPGLLPLGLPFGIIQGRGVAARLRQPSNPLHAVYQLQQERDDLQNRAGTTPITLAGQSTECGNIEH